MSADTVRAALAAVGRSAPTVVPLAEGLSSAAWRADGADGSVVVRIAKRVGAGADFVREHRVLTALAGAGVLVPTPIAGSWEQPDWTGPSFSITSYLEGEPLDPADAPAVADDLAAFLRVLQATTPPSGLPDLDARFAAAPVWPVRRGDLAGHPVSADASMAARLDERAGDAADALDGPDVLVHSDLHEGNILRASTGVGILDFGCAFIGSPLWDHAALAFFLGWPLAERVLGSASHGLAAVRLVALSFALYRWEISQDDPEESEHCAAFVRTTLER